MMRLQLKHVSAIVGNALSFCSDDSRIANYVNRACERLLYEMKSVGTFAKYRICVSDSGCVTWPREIETIESFAICSTPGSVRSQWYEFLQSGPGIVGAGNPVGGNQLIDQGEFPAFDDVIGTGKKIGIYCDAQEAAGKSINLQYYDSSGQFVTSTVDGAVIDGESIALPPAGTYAYTSRQVMAGGLVRVYKDTTKGVVRLYEFNTATAALRPLAFYERDETVPVYRRSLIPSLCGQGCGTTSTTKSITVIAKLRYMPVSDQNDFLIISHADAIRLAAQGILKEENNKLEEAAAFFAMAIRCLDRQLHHYNGDGVQQPIAMTGLQMPAVLNLI